MNIALGPLAADLVLLLGMGTLLTVDLVLPPGDKRLLGWGALYTLAAALAATFLVDLTGEAVGGAYLGDPTAVMFKRIFFATGGLAILGALGEIGARFGRRQGEYWLLVLSSVLGMSLLAGARDILLLVVCFELMGIPLYVLAAWDKARPAAVEGALKLFLVGAVSSIILLFGLSLVCGLAGSTDIAEIAAHVSRQAESGGPSPLLMLGLATSIAGVGFKLGVVPFHMWVPDTYEGATTPFVAFLGVAPKAGGVAALAQILLSEGGALLAWTAPMLIGLATATLIIGNTLALRQDNVKRLLGYSGVAHMGFVLMALATGTSNGLGLLLFYLVAYLFTNVGTFLVVHAVATSGGDDSVASFDGLGTRSSWLGMAMLLFLLSLAGIPFVVGFWAKLYVFYAAWQAGLEWLVVLGALLSVVALFYYLRVVRAIYMNPAPEGSAPITIDWGTNAAIGICLLAIVGMGVFPGPFVDASIAAAQAFLGQ